MWFFRSPTIVHGEEALGYLAELRGARAFIVTDRNIQQAGLLAMVTAHLDRAGLAHTIYADVQPDPPLALFSAARRCSLNMRPTGSWP